VRRNRHVALFSPSPETIAYLGGLQGLSIVEPHVIIVSLFPVRCDAILLANHNRSIISRGLGFVLLQV